MGVYKIEYNVVEEDQEENADMVLVLYGPIFKNICLLQNRFSGLKHQCSIKYTSGKRNIIKLLYD